MLFRNYSVGNVADQMKFDSCSFEQQPLQNYLETKELFIQTAAIFLLIFLEKCELLHSFKLACLTHLASGELRK